MLAIFNGNNVSKSYMGQENGWVKCIGYTKVSVRQTIRTYGHLTELVVSTYVTTRRSKDRKLEYIPRMTIVTPFPHVLSSNSYVNVGSPISSSSTLGKGEGRGWAEDSLTRPQ
jgi:hypothetical protein